MDTKCLNLISCELEQSTSSLMQPLSEKLGKRLGGHVSTKLCSQIDSKLLKIALNEQKKMFIVLLTSIVIRLDWYGCLYNDELNYLFS